MGPLLDLEQTRLSSRVLEIQFQDILSTNVRAEEILVTERINNGECACWVSKAIFSRHWVPQVGRDVEWLLLPEVHHTRHFKSFIVVVNERLNLIFGIVRFCLVSDVFSNLF